MYASNKNGVLLLNPNNVYVQKWNDSPLLSRLSRYLRSLPFGNYNAYTYEIV